MYVYSSSRVLRVFMILSLGCMLLHYPLEHCYVYRRLVASQGTICMTFRA